MGNLPSGLANWLKTHKRPVGKGSAKKSVSKTPMTHLEKFNKLMAQKKVYKKRNG